MKKVLAITLGLLMLFAFAACKDKNDKAETYKQIEGAQKTALMNEIKGLMETDFAAWSGKKEQLSMILKMSDTQMAKISGTVLSKTVEEETQADMDFILLLEQPLASMTGFGAQALLRAYMADDYTYVDINGRKMKSQSALANVTETITSSITNKESSNDSYKLYATSTSVGAKKVRIDTTDDNITASVYVDISEQNKIASIKIEGTVTMPANMGMYSGAMVLVDSIIEPYGANITPPNDLNSYEDSDFFEFLPFSSLSL